jgi:hypothetical protein
MLSLIKFFLLVKKKKKKNRNSEHLTKGFDHNDKQER